MKAKRMVETHELLMATRRMLRATGARARDEDPVLIKQLIELRKYLDDVIEYSVHRMRDQGVTWQQIADELGTTRQACIMRWGHQDRTDH
jgi:hypothetical protein